MNADLYWSTDYWVSRDKTATQSHLPIYQTINSSVAAVSSSGIAVSGLRYIGVSVYLCVCGCVRLTGYDCNVKGCGGGEGAGRGRGPHTLETGTLETPSALGMLPSNYIPTMQFETVASNTVLGLVSGRHPVIVELACSRLVEWNNWYKLE